MTRNPKHYAASISMATYAYLQACAQEEVAYCRKFFLVAVAAAVSAVVLVATVSHYPVLVGATIGVGAALSWSAATEAKQAYDNLMCASRKLGRARERYRQAMEAAP